MNNKLQTTLKTLLLINPLQSICIGFISWILLGFYSIKNMPGRGECDPEWEPSMTDATILKISVVVMVLSYISITIAKILISNGIIKAPKILNEE